jgi:uncharacterized repeat protein (TIGR01451 family)
MRIFNLLLTTTLLTFLGSFSSGTLAAGDAVKVTSIAQLETEVIGKDGKKTLQRSPVIKAVPGTEVIYTNTFENVSNKSVDKNLVITNPIPNDSEYKAGSVFGKDCEILFSADGGKNFGHAEDLKIKDMEGKERTALAREYTHIRWTYKKPLSPGKSGEVGFRAVIK